MLNFNNLPKVWQIQFSGFGPKKKKKIGPNPSLYCLNYYLNKVFKFKHLINAKFPKVGCIYLKIKFFTN